MSQPPKAAVPPAEAVPTAAAAPAQDAGNDDKASLEANSEASNAAVQGDGAAVEDLLAGDTAASTVPGVEDRPTDEQILSYENQIRCSASAPRLPCVHQRRDGFMYGDTCAGARLFTLHCNRAVPAVLRAAEAHRAADAHDHMRSNISAVSERASASRLVGAARAATAQHAADCDPV